MLDPELKIVESFLSGESVDVDVTTYNPPAVDVLEGSANRPFVEILDNDITNTVSLSANVFNFITGRAFQTCSSGGGGLSGQGDAMWGFWADSSCQYTSEASWGVNDIYEGAELQAPMYAHSVYPLGYLDTLNIKFGATELAFGSDRADDPSGAHENNVCYKVGSAKLLSVLNDGLSGGLGGNDTFCSTYTWKCVGTTTGEPNCPSANTEVILASDTITIPTGHSGVLFFSAKTRIQAGAPEDDDMVVKLGIKIDGVPVGSIGVQQLYTPYEASSRSLTASYLSAVGDHSSPLTAGQHTIEAYIIVETTGAKHPSVPEELTLTYFDFD